MRLKFKEVNGISMNDVSALFAQLTNAKVTAIRFTDEFIEVVLDEDEHLAESDFWTLEDETEEDDGWREAYDDYWYEIMEDPDEDL